MIRLGMAIGGTVGEALAIKMGSTGAHSLLPSCFEGLSIGSAVPTGIGTRYVGLCDVECRVLSWHSPGRTHSAGSDAAYRVGARGQECNDKDRDDVR